MRTSEINDRGKIVAIALLTRDDMRALGPALRHVYKIDETVRFDDLLRALDEMEPRSGRTD